MRLFTARLAILLLVCVASVAASPARCTGVPHYMDRNHNHTRPVRHPTAGHRVHPPPIHPTAGLPAGLPAAPLITAPPDARAPVAADAAKLRMTTYTTCITLGAYSHCGVHEPVLDASSGGSTVQPGVLLLVGSFVGSVVWLALVF